MHAATRDGAAAARATRRGALALLALFAALYVLPLGVRPLASPDEVRYGEISREMLVTGDFVVPHLNGVRYFEKPVLGYWFNAASLAVLGKSAFALRLPVALATGLTALLVSLLASRALQSGTARLAAAIFLTTLLVAGVGTFAVLDAFLAMFLTAALAAYFYALEAPRGGPRAAYLAACGAACAGAFLVKGFLALAIPVIVAAPYLALERRWRDLATTPWLPLAVAAALAAPWAVLVALREPDFWHYFFWVEHVQRFTAASAQHAEPVWYYGAWLPLAGAPWIALAPAALLGLRRGAHAPDAVRTRLLTFCACAAVLPFVFFSLSRGKLVTYILPCFAPLAILLAAGLERYLESGRRRAWRAGAALLAIVFAALLIAVVATQLGAAAPIYGPGERFALAAFTMLAAAGAVCAMVAFGRATAGIGCAAIAAAGAALALPLEVALPERALDNVAPVTAVAELGRVAPDTVLVSDAPLFGTVAWALERSDVYVVSPGEIEYGLGYADGRARRLDAAGLARLLAASRGRHEVLIVCAPSTARTLAAQLPADAVETRRGDVVFWRIPAASESLP